jgi:hypothetical protein
MDSTPTVAIRVQRKTLAQKGKMLDGSLDEVRIYMYLSFLLPMLREIGRHSGLPQTQLRGPAEGQTLWNRPPKVQQPRRLRVPAGLVRQLPSPELIC